MTHKRSPAAQADKSARRQPFNVVRDSNRTENLSVDSETTDFAQRVGVQDTRVILVEFESHSKVKNKEFYIEYTGTAITFEARPWRLRRNRAIPAVYRSS